MSVTAWLLAIIGAGLFAVLVYDKTLRSPDAPPSHKEPDDVKQQRMVRRLSIV